MATKKKATKKTTKKKQNNILVNLLLDETGSMMSCYQETIDGFNEYVQSLARKKKHKYALTLTQFNSDRIKTIYRDKPIKEVPELNVDTYQPDYMTPLYDAVGRTIKSIERTLKKRKKKPEILVVIMTDGHENASKEYTQKQVFDLITKKQEGNWTFVFMGANQDSWATGQQLGFRVKNVLDYNQGKTKETFAMLATATAGYSSSSSTSSSRSSSSFFSEDDKEAVK